ESSPLREKIAHFENSPITGIHLWFDRQISDLDHAVLLDRTIQWMFHKSRLQPMRAQSSNGHAAGSYIELVVSSSKSLIEKSKAPFAADTWPPRLWRELPEKKRVSSPPTCLRQGSCDCFLRDLRCTRRSGPLVRWPGEL